MRLQVATFPDARWIVRGATALRRSLGDNASLRPFADAAACGVLVALSAPGVLGGRWFALLAWVAFAPLLDRLPRVPVPRAALLGWLAGFVAVGGACAWLPGLLARFSDLHPVVAALLAAALVAWQALGWAAWAVVVRWAAPALPVALVAPAALVVVERCAPVVFPWSLGITQYRFLVVAQAAELGGPYVLTFLCLLFAAMLAATRRAVREGRRPPWATIALAGAALVGALSFGLLRARQVERARAASPALRVAAIQADVLRTGWTRAGDDPQRLERYQRVSAEAEREAGPFDLLLWPEKAYPFALRADARHDYAADRDARVRRGFAGPLLFGATSVDPRTRETGNSAFLLGADGALRDVYDKVRLIFYSERLPSWLAWLDGAKRYRPGTRLGPLVLDVPDPRAPGATRRVPLAVFICFEAAFPDFVRALVARGPRLLVNLADDSWFGDTAEPEEHLAQAVFRAIESRRDLVRATGSGTSALIAADGDILRRTRRNRYAAEADVVLAGDVRLLDVHGLYATLGDTFCCACAVVVFLALGLAWRRAARRPAPV